MHGGVDLDGRTKQGKVADTHLTHVENNTIEVEEDAFAQLNIRSIITIKWRLHPNSRAAFPEQRGQYLTPFGLLRFPACVQGVTQVSCAFTCSNQFGIERIV